MRWIAVLLLAVLAGCTPSLDDEFLRGDSACYLDLDGDGYGSGDSFDPEGGNCDAMPSTSRNGGDCDDSDTSRYPGAPEVAEDWIDQDCDGLDAVTCMPDLDGDGYGAPPTVLELDGACDEEDLFPSWDFRDCDDADPTLSPGVAEIPGDGIDQNCDGVDSPECWYDGDQDGFGAGDVQPGLDGTCDHEFLAEVPGDCDDSADWINPDQVEVPDDGWDQDCSGADTVTCSNDLDGDGYPAPGGWLEITGVCPPGFVSGGFGEDCNDNDPYTHPGAWDPPNDDIDQDCSGAVPDGCFEDLDSDGFGGAQVVNPGDCDGPDQVLQGGDCDDDDPDINPAAAEVVDDDIDQNCSGEDAILCYEDLDGDQYGTASPLAVDAASCPLGTAAEAGDCDDTDPWISPAIYDFVGDGIDQDCNGVDALNCFRDLDGDGWGTTTIEYDTDGDCTDDADQAPAPGDCDDADVAINPSVTDVAGDGIDQDCNGVDAVFCFDDLDGDGYGDTAGTVDPDGGCWDNPGQTSFVGDCNETSMLISPAAYDYPDDGIDQDCNGLDAIYCFQDWDQDGYGAGLALVVVAGVCSDPFLAELDGDCDNSEPLVNPGETEITGDGLDSDCDGDPES